MSRIVSKKNKLRLLQPHMISFSRKGKYVKLTGEFQVKKKQVAPSRVEMTIGARRISCIVKEAFSDAEGEWFSFECLYRVGFGLKFFRFYAVWPDGRPKFIGVRIVLSGPEDTGPVVLIHKDASKLSCGINVVGLLKHASGLGEAARSHLKSILMSSIKLQALQAPLEANCSLCESFDFSQLSAELKYRINLFHLNPPLMVPVRQQWVKAFKNGHYNIGYWFFELENLPAEWTSGFDGLDEIWVSSQFVYDAVCRISPIPVYIVPTAVDVIVPQSINKSEFGLPSDRVCVLSTFDMNSCVERKNPISAINAFLSANEKVNNLHFVLKLNNSEKHLEELNSMTKNINSLSNVTIIDSSYSREKLTRLQACVDIFISLHRSEGLGLNLLECMSLGLPVVATNWSANVDYLKANNGCPVDYQLVPVKETYGPYRAGELWADADMSHASDYLVELARSAELRHRLGDAARRTVEELYSPRVVSRSISEAVSRISRARGF